MTAFILITFLTISILIFLTLYTLYKNKKFIPLLLIILSPYAAYKTLLYSHYKAVLPSKIEVSYPVSIGEEGIFREGCSIAIFRLSDSTLQGIKTKGLDFFENALQARGHNAGERDDYYYRYEAWRETPIPPNWTSEGSWFICSNLANQQLLSNIVDASKKLGAYYTTKQEGELVVVPSLKLVVFSSFG